MRGIDSPAPPSSGKHLLISLPDSPEAEGALFEAGSLGWETRENRIFAWFPEEGRASEILSLPGAILTEVPDEDWLKKWKEGLEPVSAGIFYVRAPWMASVDPASRLREIVIPPEMAFGTGHHASTRTALALLARVVRPHASVLDFGCGSGILAIAAKKLGAGATTAVDIDARAIKATIENTRLNGVEVKALEAEAPPQGLFDVIIANIQSSIIIPLIREFRTRLNPGGKMILSGILAEESEEAFDRVEARIIAEGWKALLVSPR